MRGTSSARRGRAGLWIIRKILIVISPKILLNDNIRGSAAGAPVWSVPFTKKLTSALPRRCVSAAGRVNERKDIKFSVN
jgi:hypothetical protein